MRSRQTAHTQEGRDREEVRRKNNGTGSATHLAIGLLDGSLIRIWRELKALVELCVLRHLARAGRQVTLILLKRATKAWLMSSN